MSLFFFFFFNVFGPFFHQVVCVFWVALLFEIFLLLIFSLSVAYLFIILTLPFIELKFFNFNEVQLISFISSIVPLV